jgi:uncharacterized protein (TIGR02597 family)
MLAAHFTPRAMLIAFAIFGSSGGALAADSAVSEPVGAFVRPAGANTDTLFSVTFSRPPAARGTVASVSGSTLTASGSPGWTSNAFVSSSTHYVRMLSGTYGGQFFIVTANTASALTVDSAGLNLTQIVAGDSFEVTPFWTLGTLFPASAAGSAFISSPNPANLGTQLLFFSQSSVAINRAPSTAYFFMNGAWRRAGDPLTTSFDSTIVFPDTYFILRNRSTSTSVTQLGRVQAVGLGTVLEGGSASSRNDNIVSVSHPVPVSLGQLGLVSAGFLTSPTPVPRDQLLLFDVNATGYNRAPAETYFYFNNGWRKAGDPLTNEYSAVTIPAGSGFIIRKAVASTGHAWTFLTGI